MAGSRDKHVPDLLDLIGLDLYNSSNPGIQILSFAVSHEVGEHRTKAPAARASWQPIPHRASWLPPFNHHRDRLTDTHGSRANALRPFSILPAHKVIAMSQGPTLPPARPLKHRHPGPLPTAAAATLRRSPMTTA